MFNYYYLFSLTSLIDFSISSKSNSSIKVKFSSSCFTLFFSYYIEIFFFLNYSKSLFSSSMDVSLISIIFLLIFDLQENFLGVVSEC